MNKTKKKSVEVVKNHLYERQVAIETRSDTPVLGQSREILLSVLVPLNKILLLFNVCPERRVFEVSMVLFFFILVCNLSTKVFCFPMVVPNFSRDSLADLIPDSSSSGGGSACEPE